MFERVLIPLDGSDLAQTALPRIRPLLTDQTELWLVQAVDACLFVPPEYPLAGPTPVGAIEAAQAAQPAWRALTAKERAARLRKWYELMLANQEDLAQIMTAEQGKPLKEAMGEIAYGASFVEFFGDGLSNLPLANRATIANMSPEYGATCGFFPVDDETLAYLLYRYRVSPCNFFETVMSKHRIVYKTFSQSPKSHPRIS